MYRRGEIIKRVSGATGLVLLAVSSMALAREIPAGAARASAADQGAIAVAAANDAPPAIGRFTMAPVDGGFLRMDTDTGTVSLCARKEAVWRCETVPDDYKALQLENEALKKELAELKRDGGSAGGAGKGDRKIELPSEEDVDKALGKVDKYLRKFRELIEKYQSPEPPGRT